MTEPLTRARWLRAALLAPGALALLVGMNAGLERLGAASPVSNGRAADAHGALMVLGFVGTVIALERAVALGRWAGFLAPLLLGAGAVATVSPLPPTAGRALLLAGTVALIVLYLPLYRRQHDTAVAVEIVGAVLAAGAAVLLLREVSFPLLLPWLAGFIILTIVGERLELARVALLAPSATSVLFGLVGALCLGIALTLVLPVVGYPVAGVVLLMLVAWLVRFDVARRTVRSQGLPRFTAASLLAGYAWLAVAGGIWLLSTGVPSGGAYDASVHAVFLGFTLSMIMAHAPIILPAVLRRPLPYTAAFYAPAVLLHLSLVIRLLIGDGFGNEHARTLGGTLNVVAIVLFLLVAVASAMMKGERDA